METLKLEDSGNYFNENNCMLQPKCRQPYVHNHRNMKSNMLNDELSTPKLPPRPPLPKIAQLSTTIDKDLAKQQQLSDWYYIKTGPKSPLPAIRSEKQIENAMSQTTNKKPNATISNISGSNGNTSINCAKNSFVRVRVGREGTTNTQNTGKHIPINNDNSRLCENIQLTKPDSEKTETDTMRTFNNPNVVLRSDDIQNVHIPFAHQYAVNEPLCKFNCGSNSKKVNGCLKRQHLQESHTPIVLPPSPVVTTKKVHQEQSHPFYYIESTQKHFFTPKQGSQHIKHSVHSQQKINEHCEQSQHLKSTVKVSTIVASNSNSNIHKITGTHSQQFKQSGDANSISFEHVNVPNGISPLSASSEMAIDNKHHFINHNYTDERICRTESNSGIEYRPNVSSSPTAQQSKVSN